MLNARIKLKQKIQSSDAVYYRESDRRFHLLPIRFLSKSPLNKKAPEINPEASQ